MKTLRTQPHVFAAFGTVNRRRNPIAQMGGRAESREQAKPIQVFALLVIKVAC